MKRQTKPKSSISEMRYKAWDEVSYTTPNMVLSTRNTFTGQYSYVSDDATDLGTAGFGLMFYCVAFLWDNARWYDPSLGRFAQADTIVPGGVQGLDRYVYTFNNPLSYNDPSGHDPKGDCIDNGSCIDDRVALLAQKIRSTYKNVTIQDISKWNLVDLMEIWNALNKINGPNGFNGNTDAFIAAYGNITFVPVPNGSLGTTGTSQNVANSSYDNPSGVIRVTPLAGQDQIIHEMGHMLDGTLRRANPEADLRSQEFVEKFNRTGWCTTSPCYDDFGGWIPNGQTTEYGKTSSLEDFADSFLATFKYGPTYVKSTIGSERILIIKSLIQSYTDLLCYTRIEAHLQIT